MADTEREKQSGVQHVTAHRREKSRGERPAAWHARRLYEGVSK